MQTLKDLILAEHSKAQANVIADIVRQKPELLNELLQYILANEEPLSRRASWPLRILHEQHPELLKSRIGELIYQLANIKSSAVLRNILALLAHAEIPENKKTFLLDFSAQTILNPESPVAVICHATDLFIHVSEKECVLLQELMLMLMTIEPNRSGGVQAKIKQVKATTKNLGKASS